MWYILVSRYPGSCGSLRARLQPGLLALVGKGAPPRLLGKAVSLVPRFCSCYFYSCSYYFYSCRYTDWEEEARKARTTPWHSATSWTASSPLSTTASTLCSARRGSYRWPGRTVHLWIWLSTQVLLLLLLLLLPSPRSSPGASLPPLPPAAGPLPPALFPALQGSSYSKDGADRHPDGTGS